ATEIERLPARCYDPKRRSCGEEVGNDRRRLEEMLEVVEHEKHLTRTNPVFERAPVVESQRLRDRGANESGLVNGCEPDEHRLLPRLGHLESQARLPDSSGTHQGHEPYVGPA